MDKPSSISNDVTIAQNVSKKQPKMQYNFGEKEVSIRPQIPVVRSDFQVNNPVGMTCFPHKR